MKKTWNGKIVLLFKGMVLALVWFQALTAIVWGIANIASIQPFAQTQNYLSVKECLQTVGYDSVGYAYFIVACRVLQRITRIPFYAVAYLLQMMLCNGFIHSGCAAFIRGTTGKKAPHGSVALVTVLILTNPFMWQMVFAMLPDALAFSLVIYGIGNAFLFVKTIGKGRNFSFAFANLFSLFLLLYLQRYSFYVCIGCTFVICFAGLIKILIKKEARDEDNLARELVFAFGMAGMLALALFVVISDTQWISAVTMDKTTLKKVFSGALSPFVLAKKEYPFGDNVNALYLNIMWQKRPALTYFYVSATRLGFAICIPCLIIKGLFERIGTNEKVAGIIRNALFFGLLILATAVYGAFVSPAEFDFRYFFVPCMTWAVWGASLYGVSENKETTGEEE